MDNLDNHDNTDNLPALPADNLPALLPEHADQQFFAEELDIMRIILRRIHRKVIDLDMHGLDALVEVPDIEGEVLAETIGHAELEQVTAELDEAEKGQDSVTAELAKWKEELAAA
jgi:hypothetical protein